MKMTHAFLLLIASAPLAMTSQAAVSSEVSNPVTRAIWKCKGNGSVTSITVTVDPAKNISSGELKDPSLFAEPVRLKYGESAYQLGGAVYGHDVREYDVQLLPSSGYDYLASSTKTQTTGTAEVTYGGFIDCVGDVSGTETLTCEVELERASN